MSKRSLVLCPAKVPQQEGTKTVTKGRLDERRFGDFLNLRAFRLPTSVIAFLFLISNIPVAAEPDTIEIYEYYGSYTLDAPPPEMHPIILSIPNEFLYARNRLPKRDWGVNILTYYPSFTSPQNPANADFGLSCVGICNGRILISVNNRAHSIGPNSPNMGDFIARAQLKWLKFYSTLPNIRVTSIDPKGIGFDEAFERNTTTMPGEKTALAEQIYLKKGGDGEHYDLAATCEKNEARATCILHFSLRCDPKVYVSINLIDGTYLSQASSIRAKADQFVSAMVKNSPCAI